MEYPLKPTYNIFLCCPPTSGHSLPLLRVGAALQKRGHKITYATSFYDIPNLKKKYPEFDFVELQDQANVIDKSKEKIMGPPLHLYY